MGAQPPAHAGGSSPALPHTPEERTRLIIETANDAFVAIDRDSTIVEWNRAAEATFGWPADEALGRRLDETVIPPAYREAHRRGLRRFLRTGEQRVLFQRVELPALHRDGHQFPVEVTIWPTREVDGWRFNAFLRDISDRVRMQAHAEVLHRITATANATGTAERAVRRAERELLELTGWQLAHTYVPSRQGLRPTGWWEPGTAGFAEFCALTERTVLSSGEGLPGRVTDSRRPAWIVDLAADDGLPRREAAIACGLRSAHAFPVMVEDRVVAVLELFATASHAPDEPLLALMADVGVQLGRVFERHEQELWQRTMIATVAHELRTPLATMTGFTGLLEDSWDELDEGERLDHLRTINSQGQRLHRLVADLLTLSRLQNRAIATEPTPVPLDAVVREAIAGAGLRDVAVAVPADATALVDRDHLVQILTNLLANAVKYGAPPIEVTGAATPDRVEVRVRDHGPGVDPSFAPRLFEPFARADDAAGRSGTGLGLSIVHNLAEANGGQVRYRPADPRGACFVVELPRAPRPHAAS